MKEELVFEDPPERVRGPRSQWATRVKAAMTPEAIGRWTRWESGSRKAVERAAESLGAKMEFRFNCVERPDGSKKTIMYWKVIPPPPPPEPTKIEFDKEANEYGCSDCPTFSTVSKRKAESHLATVHGDET